MRPDIRRPEPTQELETRERCWILEVANDQGDEELSIARARVSPGVTTEWHELRDTGERYVIVQGHGRMEIEGLPSTPVQPGDVIRIPASTPQRIANIGETDLVFYCICTPRFEPHCYVSRFDFENSKNSPISGR